ncbi:MAG: L-fucose/L-arabinose isomerase family protein [Victivallales bacterium]|nr:L-fucose/L-arabinose isomerase family protein [Victivallales bacterium]
MSNLKVGYMSLVKGSWINDKLEGQRQQALRDLENLDAEIVDCGMLIQSETEAEAVYRKFEDAQVDVILAHFITFSLGSIVPGMAVKLRKPVIFWSEPEPPMTGGRIAANSFCATNMNAHALWKMHLKYTLVYGHADAVVPELNRQLKVFECVKALKRVRIGSLGGRVPGFYTSDFNELAMREKFGAEVEGITLLELVKVAESIGKDELDEALAMVKGSCICKITDEELNKGAALLAAFRKLSAKYRLDAWTARCWPEFSDIYGIGVCHILGCMTQIGIPVACEGDAYGALAMMMVKILSGSDAFFCDLISFDQHGDTGLFWHCGAAPVSLCKDGCTPQLLKHSIIDGGDKKGIAVEFPLKPGPVTVVRIGDARDGNGYRLLSIGGEGVDTTQLLHGTPLTVKFNRPAEELVEKLVDSGFEHHYVLCHGDVRKELRLFAKMLDMELVEL